MRASFRTVTAIVLLWLAHPVVAQDNPAVGLWSTTLYQANGEAFASIWIEFSPDGSFHQQMLVTAGIADYYGTWSLDSERSTLTTTYYRYTPETIPPAFVIGQPYTQAVEFPNSSQMIIAQDGTVPLVMVRQR